MSGFQNVVDGVSVGVSSEQHPAPQIVVSMRSDRHAFKVVETPFADGKGMTVTLRAVPRKRAAR